MNNSWSWSSHHGVWSIHHGVWQSTMVENVHHGGSPSYPGAYPKFELCYLGINEYHPNFYSLPGTSGWSMHQPRRAMWLEKSAAVCRTDDIDHHGGSLPNIRCPLLIMHDFLLVYFDGMTWDWLCAFVQWFIHCGIRKNWHRPCLPTALRVIHRITLLESTSWSKLYISISLTLTSPCFPPYQPLRAAFTCIWGCGTFKGELRGGVAVKKYNCVVQRRKPTQVEIVAEKNTPWWKKSHHGGWFRWFFCLC